MQRSEYDVNPNFRETGRSIFLHLHNELSSINIKMLFYLIHLPNLHFYLSISNLPSLCFPFLHAYFFFFAFEADMDLLLGSTCIEVIGCSNEFELV